MLNYITMVRQYIFSSVKVIHSTVWEDFNYFELHLVARLGLQMLELLFLDTDSTTIVNQRCVGLNIALGKGQSSHGRTAECNHIMRDTHTVY